MSHTLSLLSRYALSTVYSHWMPKDIYEELVKLNGEPDETDVEPDNKYHYDMYVWYGKNGTLVMVEDKYSRSIDVSLEIEER